MRFGTKATLAAIATAAALALSACGSGSTSSSSGGPVNGAGKTLDVFIGRNTTYPQQQQQWFTDTAAAFKKATGADLKFETFASGNDELTKIQTSAVSGQGPDIYDLGTTFTPTAVATGAFAQLSDSDWNAIGGKSKFNQSALGISGPDSSHLYAVPFVSRPFVMAYNTTLLKAAGIDKPATTWDGLVQQAKKLTDPSKGQYGMAVAYKDNFDPWKYIWAMSEQQGNKLVDGKTANINNSTVSQAYQTYFGWLTQDKVVDPASVGWSNSQALANFASGKSAFFLMTSTGSLNTLNNSAIKNNFDYALMPTSLNGSNPNGGTAVASILSGDNMGVASYSKNKDLALAFLKLVTDKDQQLNYQKIFGDLPTNADALASLDSAPHMAAVTDSAKKSYATPFTGAWADIQLALVNVVVQSIPDLASGNVSDSNLSQRLQAAQNTAQQSLSRAK
ncbi:ABC transporter substrate-binding protein [Sinomonas sp.]|jgi:multiple sugar transport system substrate-binding protein|uniref:ABC transporter substrate-binding protein n=1 Tax=Sinomonas sp. TaxID=1914986 RepID=UPI002FE19CF3